MDGWLPARKQLAYLLVKMLYILPTHLKKKAGRKKWLSSAM